MFWADRITRVAGMAMLLLVALVITDVVLETTVVGDARITDRADLEGVIQDINADEDLFYLGTGVSLVSDGIVSLVVAAVLFLLFRDRSPLLSLFVLIGLLTASVIFLASDSAAAVTGILAADYVQDGGPGGISAGDPATLQAARVASAFWGIADLFGLTVLAASLLALGALIAFAPAGELNPPRWLGGVAIGSSTFMLLSWVHLLNEDIGFTILGVGLIGSLSFLSILGGWLLTRPQVEPGMGEASTAVASV